MHVPRPIPLKGSVITIAALTLVCYSGSVHDMLHVCYSSSVHLYMAFYMYVQARVQEFVRGGGGQDLKAFFFAFQFFRGGGAAQKIDEKMIFSTKKVAKYR